MILFIMNFLLEKQRIPFLIGLECMWFFTLIDGYYFLQISCTENEFFYFCAVLDLYQFHIQHLDLDEL